MRVRSETGLSREGNAGLKDRPSGLPSHGRSVKLVPAESARRRGWKNFPPPLRVSARSIPGGNVRNGPKRLDHLARAVSVRKRSVRKGPPKTSVNPGLKRASRRQVMRPRVLPAVGGVGVGPDGAGEANRRANSLPAEK